MIVTMSAQYSCLLFALFYPFNVRACRIPMAVARNKRSLVKSAAANIRPVGKEGRVAEHTGVVRSWPYLLNRDVAPPSLIIRVTPNVADLNNCRRIECSFGCSRSINRCADLSSRSFQVISTAWEPSTGSLYTGDETGRLRYEKKLQAILIECSLKQR